jgi:hypothetical protein
VPAQSYSGARGAAPARGILGASSQANRRDERSRRARFRRFAERAVITFRGTWRRDIGGMVDPARPNVARKRFDLF